MAHKMSGYVDVDGGVLYYEIAGEGTPIVFNHAAFLDSRMFDAQVEAFAGEYRVIRYDMRGFGQSGAVTGPVCRRGDLAALLDALGIERAHWVGCSMGGEVMLDLALEQPERVLSLTLVASTPSGFELQGEPPRYLMEMIGAMQQGDIERSNDLQIRIWFDGSYREPDQVDAALREKALAMNRIPVERGTYFVADSEPPCPLDPPAVTRLSEVICPVLIVDGALDHPEINRGGDVMAAEMVNARKVVIEGAAHVPSFEQPDVFNQVLRGFLEGKGSRG